MRTGRHCLAALFSLSVIAFFFSCIATSVDAASLQSGFKTDIQYGHTGGEDLLLDAFTPSTEGLHPVVIIVHGGGWIGGDKEDMSLLYQPLSDAGFTWFSINYRLAPEHRWPACLDDVQTAIKWVKKHASEYKGDASKIAIVGYSAGGHLACMAGIKEPVQAIVGISAPTDHLADSSRRGGASECIQKLLDCPSEIDADVEKQLNSISPINYLSVGLPPFLLIHGTADQSVPYSQSVNLKDKLDKLHVPCDLITLNDVPHRISDWTNYDKDFRPAFIFWLADKLNNPRVSCVPEVDPQCNSILVSKRGNGQFKTVQAAVDSVADNSDQPTYIIIEPGIYKEKLVIPQSKRCIHFKGQDPLSTIITYDLYASVKDENGKEIGTFRTPSVTIEADDFTAENITFENSAGDVGQAVALAVLGDRIVFRNCRLLGWQDTLLDQSGRHYYENCYIAGHCDFIFGGGVAYFDKCHIHCLTASYITAASTPEHQKYGYIFSDCRITGTKKSRVYLGRPWRDFAYVAFINTEMAGIIRPQGWHNWSKPHREKTSRYYEYNCSGPGAKLDKRVPWSKVLTDQQAKEITIANVLSGDDNWNPQANSATPSVKLSFDNAAAQKLASAIKKKNRLYLSICSGEVASENLALAYSPDGINWQILETPFTGSAIGTHQKGSRASLSQAPSGEFHLIWQSNTPSDTSFGYAKSTDLVNWTNLKYIDMMSVHKAYDLYNPHLFYDNTQKDFIISWSSTLPSNYFQSYQEELNNNPRIWHTRTTDFETFTPAQVFFEPGYRVDDAAISKNGSQYLLIHEDSRDRYDTLRFATSTNSAGPWQVITDNLAISPCSFPAVLQTESASIIYYSTGSSTQDKAFITSDYNNCYDISAEISLPTGYALGDIISVESSVIEKLSSVSNSVIKKSIALEPIEPIKAPFAMSDLQRPEFPDRAFDIRDYGAVSDGKTYNTKAFADAVKACSKAGGGWVLVPAGKWFTGPIHLASNINLHLAEGSEIIFSDICEDYLPVVLVRVGGVEIYNYSPLIYARDCSNVAITGPGKLNGNAASWWTMKGKETGNFFEMAAQGVPVDQRVFGTREAAIRPSFLCLMNCKNILLEGFTIGSGPNWTVHPIYCENIIIRRVNVITDGPNNDGIDPDSCRNVLIEHCLFDTGDDCVVLKSGYNEDGWRVGKPTENVVMRYCSSKRGHGGLVIGSEMSGDVRNVYMHDCQFEGTDRAVRIKSKRGRGGIVENVWARNLKLKNMQREAVILNMVYGSDRNKISNEKAPKFRNIHISHLDCIGAPTAILMRALADSPIENVSFDHVNIESKSGIICENVKSSCFEAVTVINQKGPVYQLTDCSDILISNNSMSKDVETFIHAKGSASADIIVTDTDLSKAVKAIKVSDGAEASAIHTK